MQSDPEKDFYDRIRLGSEERDGRIQPDPEKDIHGRLLAERSTSKVHASRDWSVGGRPVNDSIVSTDPGATNTKSSGQGALLAIAACVVALFYFGSCGEITPESAIKDFCATKSSAESTEQACVEQLEAHFTVCRSGEKARGIDIQDTTCLNEARDGWGH
jgi:hypothetical protein